MQLLTKPATGPNTAGPPDESHLRRLSFAYRLATLALVSIGLFWLTWLFFEGGHPLMLVNATYVLAGLYLWQRIRVGNFYFAAMTVQLFLFLVITQICLLYDVPNAAAPRVTHIYFLALAFLSYVTFRRVNLAMTYAVVLVYLAGFIVFSSSSYAPPFAQPLPDHVRVAGAWIHSGAATAIMCGCVFIMQSDLAAGSSLGRQLTLALARNEFELHYQPQVDRERVVTGAEALIRWNSALLGLVPRDRFIPAAEQLGMIGSIGAWVRNAACAQRAAWASDPATAGLKVAVNVSAQQFHDAGFVDEVRQIVRQHGVDPARLELELTESIVVGDVDDVIARMQALADFGISMSLDDFGTGYSSLKYLKRMPFRQVKIDREFVRDMLDDERDAAIVKGIVQLGHEMHLSVIAEGVETEAQHAFLREIGCTEFQGFLFGRPVPAHEFPRQPAAPVFA